MKQIKNIYKCNSKLWNKFSELSKEIFNDVYAQAINNQGISTHPKTKLPQEEWKTIVYNLSVYAAWALDEIPLKKSDIVEDINVKTNKVVKTHKVK